ncbi:MAG TPA: CopG family transcriptional regulator [Ignavibacteria bacterium]|nr:CopG family transcriptional regulator [Ignavibacteria bacterium]
MAVTTKIAISVDKKVLQRIDKLVDQNLFPSRSRAIQIALEEKLSKIDKSRLAVESSKLNKNEEQSLAEEGLIGEINEWPEY